jgi:hypothetical protein
MNHAVSFLSDYKWPIIGGAILGIVFRSQIGDMFAKVKDTKAAEIVYRPKPLDGVNDGRTVGQKRMERDGASLQMVNRGRAIGQTIAHDPSNAITPSPIPMGHVYDPNMDTVMHDGKFTDAALKYTVSSFGANYSGSAIGVQ